MNKNPILKTYSARILYATIWVLVSIIQVLVHYFKLGDPLNICITKVAIYNGLFACIAIPLWYTLQFNQKGYKGLAALIAKQVLIGVLIVAIWGGASFVLTDMIVNDDEFRLFLIRAHPLHIITGAFYYIFTIFVYYMLLYNDELKRKSRSEDKLHELLKDTELNLLKSQINPHFLFNSLNSVSSLIITSPEKAREMIVAISDFWRYTVSCSNKPFVTLNDEIENVQRYLSIEKMRFGNKLQAIFDVDPSCLVLHVPAMMLQPLYENAVKHGVYESTETVNIYTLIKRQPEYLQIEVSNEVGGRSLLEKKGSGVGLKNIRERLRLIYGAPDLLVTKEENGRYHAILHIPNKGKGRE